MIQTIELTSEQHKEIVNTYQLFTVYQERMEHANHFQGSMSWKTVNGRDYLYKKIKGYAKCLGVRNEETECTYQSFVTGKIASRKAVTDIFEQMKVQARYAKAARINRMPIMPAKIIRKIQKNGLGDQISIIGTHAMYGYESMASKYITAGLMETADIDFLWDKRMPLLLSINNIQEDGMLGILQSVDRSFERMKAPYRAVNSKGFIVDLISDEHDIRGKFPVSIGHGKHDIQSASIGSLKWLINAPRVIATVIDAQGFPLNIRIPDPRCFAVHKAWLSRQSSRGTDKAHRDLQQAKVVASMIVNDMAGFDFTDEQLQMFPVDIRNQAKDELHLDDDWMPSM